MAKATEWRNLQEALAAQGCTLINNKGRQHLKVFKNGRYITSIPCTPGKGRGYLNARAQLRRLGFTIN